MDRKDILWFPMRVTYNRETKVKESLDNLGIENFMPVKQQFVIHGGHKKLETLPAIHNLLFVHSSREKLTELKMTEEEFSPLRYMMTRPLQKNARAEIITIPDRSMDNFIRVASHSGDSVIYLDYDRVANKVGRKVVITDGPFAGIEGCVIRVDNNRRVVVKLENVLAVAIAFVPSAFLKFV
ncbi:MAG: UpxY family transcription antiterminator [Bacteroidales bacterium]|nr:UpxY family transcription antiterminator [Bacteroidales bacterium]